MDKETTLQIVRQVLAADFSCEESHFGKTGTWVVEAQNVEGRRKFPFRRQSLGIITMGMGTVISCNAERMEWVKKTLGPLSRDQMFSATTIACIEHFLSGEEQYLAGQDLKYVCSTDTFRPGTLLENVDIQMVEGVANVQKLYAYGDFPNALGYRPDRARQDVLATAARQSGKIVGIAGASADSEAMWQIGVDVLPDSRRRGIGRALVRKLTDEVLQRGKIPYYNTAPSNLFSRKLAIEIGYWPAWTELYARNKA